MRAEEFETKYEIKYIPGNIESMKNALKYYRELIESGEAFEDSYCVAHFIPEEQGIISDDDLKAYLTGEELFFKYAVDFSELEEDLKLTCESIVNYSRELNDSADMWITCEEPFGIKPLYIFASKYPKYGYLLGSFMVPYWDDEHMPESLYTLSSWSNKFGITEDTLKAFCYCDNKRAREIMLGYDNYESCYEEDEEIDSSFNLLKKFRESPETYELFKKILIERFNNMEFLQYTDSLDCYVKNPVRELVLDILYLEYPYDIWDDDFDIDEYLLNIFVEKQADEEAEEIKELIEKNIGRPIVLPYEEVEKIFNEKRDLRWNKHKGIKEIKKWEDLICKVFPKGKLLWEYVCSGKNKELLDELSEFDIVKDAALKNCILADELEDATISFPLYMKINKVLRGYIKEKFENDDEETEDVLRLYDILHIVMGKNPIQENTITDFLIYLSGIEELKLYKRYSTTWDKEIGCLLQSIPKLYIYEKNIEDILEEIYILIDKNRDEFKEKIDEFLEAVDYENFLSVMIFSIYLLKRDNFINKNDEITKKFEIFMESNCEKFIFSKMPNCIKKYIMTGIFKNEKLEDSEEEFSLALEYFKNSTEKNESEEINKNQPIYEWLCGSRESLEIVFYAAYLGCDISNLKYKNIFKRFLKISFGCAPLRVINLLRKVNDNLKDFENLENLQNSLKKLKPLGLSDEVYEVYQLVLLNKELRGENISILNLASEEDHIKHYVRLILTIFDDIQEVGYGVNPLNIFIPELKILQKNLLNGMEIISRRDIGDIINSAGKVLKMNKKITELSDRVVLEKLKRTLKNNLETPTRYLENLLKLKNIKFKREREPIYDINEKEILEKLKALDIPKSSEKDLILAKKIVERDGVWHDILINDVDEKLEVIYNENILNYLIDCLEKGVVSNINGFDFIVAKNCKNDFIENVNILKSVDFKEHALDQFNKFMDDKIDTPYIRELFRCGVYYYNFLGDGGYYDIYLDDVINNLSKDVLSILVNIIGEIDFTKLDFDLKNDKQKIYYAKMLLESGVNKVSILKYLISEEYDIALKYLLEQDDFSSLINELDISERVYFLQVAVHNKKYHSLILKLKNHSSIKIKKCVKNLIEEYKVGETLYGECKIVDYGIYQCGTSEKISNNGSAATVAYEPECIKKTASIKVQLGMYIGLRFTGVNIKNPKEICDHKVIVTHPFKDENGEIKVKKSSWMQNGYLNSNIFMGWIFETEAELISGDYIFSAYDKEGTLLVEKKLVVK